MPGWEGNMIIALNLGCGVGGEKKLFLSILIVSVSALRLKTTAPPKCLSKEYQKDRIKCSFILQGNKGTDTILYLAFSSDYVVN